MKTIQLVITTLIYTVLMPASMHAQQYVMDETNRFIDYPYQSAEPSLHIGSDVAALNTIGVTTRGDLEDFILDEMEQKHIPGLSAVLLKDFKVAWSGHFGYADISLGKPVTGDTLFYIASTTKVVTATALMQLWEEGLFELDDPINDYLSFAVVHPDYPNTDITFNMLLTHTSAINDGYIPADVWDRDHPIPLGYFLEEYFTPGGLYYYQSNFNGWEPGTQWSYASVDIALAGYMVKVISGMELEPYCQENIFAPLKMDNTSYFLANLDIEDIAVPYVWIGGSYVAQKHNGWVCYPAGQIRTSAPQLTNFLKGFMKNAHPYQPPFNVGNPNSNPAGHLMSALNSSPSFIKINDDPTFAPRLWDSLTVDTMLTPYLPIPGFPGASQGLTWFYSDASTYPVWGHMGSFLGANSEMWYAPEKEVGVVVLANIMVDLDDIRDAIMLYGYGL